MSDKVKKISEFPEIMADNVKVLGVSQTGENVRVRLDIKQGRGSDTGALMSQAGITAELARQDAEIKRVSAKYGYYVSEESLLAVNPIGTIGDRAYVGVSAPYAIYEWNGYAWENTGMVSEDSDVNNKADKDGTYPKMSVGFAENIVGDGSATPEVFSFRPTAGENRNTLNDGAARIQVLKGSSVVCNQLGSIYGGAIAEQEINGIRMTIEGDNIVFNGVATASAVFTLFNVSKTIVGHKYLFNISTNYTDGEWGKYCAYLPNEIWKTLNLGGQTFIGEAVMAMQNPAVIFTVWKGVTVSNIKINKNFKFIDLTQMFGAEEAAKINSVQDFYQRKPIGVDLAAYNEGEIVNGNYKAIKTTGFNQWDEEWKNGYYDKTTGVFKSNANYLCSKNPIKVIGGSIYNILSTFPNQIELCYYDASGNLVGSQIAYNGRTYTIPNGVCLLNFSTYATNYNGQQFCINLSWDEYASMNDTYKPYKSFVRDLSWVAKYFPNGMRSAGNVADEIRFNDTTQKWEAVQRVGVVDLGSLEWSAMSSASSSVKIMRTFFDLKALATNEVGNITSEKFTPSTADDVYLLTSDKTIAAAYHATGNYIAVYDSEYPTAADASSFKAAMQGVLLNYELAEPIVTEITENVNLDYDCSDYGTEELVSDGVSAPLSANIVYEPNVLATIKNLPNLFARLVQMEAMVSAMAVATTNMNE